ncbi:endo-1,4-beta-xylanase [Leptolyngbya sp. FACHB-17]|uniref:endo-1,4-beta-xylanase n=1 Tax=unclassified Leptolyngbya TaxID=2650499 RepID=UPI00167FE366|nr:endo-1,4-beta-xylanase [Leptolyngbya sp. FACHB-17]MBD2081101.1 endo-1,4-beta-xylanase [Leptolyngbya sp. FACHB-17]
MTLSRRRTLQLGLGAVAAAGCSGIERQPVRASDNPKQTFSMTGEMQLKQRAAAKGLIYGSAASYSSLKQDPQFAKLFAETCGILVPENELKWGALRPASDRYDFTQADWMADYAQQNNILFRGHNLAWKHFNPDWLEGVTSRNAEQVLTRHITTVMKRYAGRMHSWDVVNEAIAGIPSWRSDGLQTSPWLTMLDKDYIDIAFRAAAAADPKAMLVYNDTALEYEKPEDERTRSAVLALLRDLKSRKIPVHALGIQAHLDAAETRFNANKLRRFLSDVASLGLKILITEMDVKDQNLPPDRELRDRSVARTYEEYLSVVLDEPAVVAVMTWGLSDRYTWLTETNPRKDGLAIRPLPYDENLGRKPAWNAIARAFDAAPKRS